MSNGIVSGFRARGLLFWYSPEAPHSCGSRNKKILDAQAINYLAKYVRYIFERERKWRLRTPRRASIFREDNPTYLNISDVAFFAAS